MTFALIDVRHLRSCFLSARAQYHSTQRTHNTLLPASSMLQRHRKSQSTSALSVIADGGPLPPVPPFVERDKQREGERERRAKRLSQHPALGRVDEIVHAQMPDLPGLSTPGKGRTGREMHAEGSKARETREKERQHRARSRGAGAGEAEVRAWMGDVSSVPLSFGQAASR